VYLRTWKYFNLYQSRGFRNTTGMANEEAKDFFFQQNRYHWDEIFEEGIGGSLLHGPVNPHGHQAHMFFSMK